MLQVILYSILSPFLWFLVLPIALFTKKGRERILKESSIFKRAIKDVKSNINDRKLLIFHAASAGEFEQLKPLLPLVDQDHYFILQTFMSPTIYRKEYNSNLFNAVCYHPADSIFRAIYFFKKLKPKAYILNRHDLWPAHLLAAKVLGIKTILINANMHEKSSRYKFPFRPLNRWMFNSLSLILCGSDRVKNGIYKLAPSAQVEIVGETRFDQVIIRKEANHKNHFTDDIMNRKNIVLGSIIPSDYDIVFKGIREFAKDKSLKDMGIRIIAVPHEVAKKDIAQLQEKLEEYGFTYHCYSDSQSGKESDVLIVDTVGILAELYVYAYCAYVGAGFGAGVHNVIEPAVYGVPTFYGPNFHILDEAVSMANKSVATVVNSEEDVSKYFKNLNDKKSYHEIKKRTLSFVEDTASSSQKVIDRIMELCK